MPDYRLITDEGHVVAESAQDHDQAAVTWRSTHPFEAPGVDEGRQLRLERRTDDGWVRLDPLGTSEID